MQPNIDYAEVGLIAGLEVHQQLATKEKLFCRCPAGVYVDTHDGEVLRHMRPTLSELGEYDGTALMEFKTKKQIVYLLNQLNVCTYEMDDTPPFLINQAAIDIAIELCLMMNMDIIDEVHIARKQYLDGSIPTGFQRTAIVGVNGFLPFQGRKLSVTHLSVEEDSCREVEDKGHRIVFRTDRLGMPLTETVTGPDLRTPQEVREAILLCGLLARSTGQVRTGIGAARQDVNVSVRGGSRVEIKGVPQAQAAMRLVHNEAIRQVNLLALRDELHQRGLRRPDDLTERHVDVTYLMSEVELPFLQQAMAAGAKVYGVKVGGVGGLGQHPTQPDTTFVDELMGRVRVIACLDEPPILLDHPAMRELLTDHLARGRMRKRLKTGDQDGCYLVWGPEADCITAAAEIRNRWADAVVGVPEETRQALPSGHTTFERILPGPDRMYPDTDSPPTRITEDRVEKQRAGLPPVPWERKARYAQWGVPEETTDYLIRRGGAAIVDQVVEATGVDGKTAAIEIGQRAKALRRQGLPMDSLGGEHWAQVFDLYVKGEIPREGIREVASLLARQPGLSADEARVAVGIDLQESDGWSAQLDQIDLASARDDAGTLDPARVRRLTGEAVRALAGQVPAKEVAALVNQRFEELQP